MTGRTDATWFVRLFGRDTRLKVWLAAHPFGRGVLAAVWMGVFFIADSLLFEHRAVIPTVIGGAIFGIVFGLVFGFARERSAAER